MLVVLRRSCRHNLATRWGKEPVATLGKEPVARASGPFLKTILENFPKITGPLQRFCRRSVALSAGF